MSSVSEFTGSVPATYDQYLGPLFFEPYALELVGRIDQKLERVLEVACGTGRVTRHLTERIAGNGVLYATDLNPDMLQIAKEKVTDPKVQWKVVDAHELPFNDGFFDLVVCQFGVMFFQDKEKAFREVNRVLKKGGTFLFNTWDEVQHNTVSNLAQEVLQEVLGPEAPDFLEKGPYSLYNQPVIQRLITGAGFKDQWIEPVQILNSDFSAADAAQGILEGSPLTGYLQEKNAPREEIKQTLIEKFNNKTKEGAFRMQALVCRCIK